MPLRISTTGLCSAPAETIIWRAAMLKLSPLPRVNRAASTRPPLITSRSSGVSVSTVRFGRRRTSGERYTSAALPRVPFGSTLNVVGNTPSAQGPFWSSCIA